MIVVERLSEHKDSSADANSRVLRVCNRRLIRLVATHPTDGLTLWRLNKTSPLCASGWNVEVFESASYKKDRFSQSAVRNIGILQPRSFMRVRRVHNRRLIRLVATQPTDGLWELHKTR